MEKTPSVAIMIVPGALGAGGLQLRLQIVHVGIGVAIAPRLAQADAVDDRGVVQRVGDHRVLGAQKRLEQPAIGIETGSEEDRVILAEVTCQPRPPAPGAGPACRR
jgi:hypothetical protein